MRPSCFSAAAAASLFVSPSLLAIAITPSRCSGFVPSHHQTTSRRTRSFHRRQQRNNIKHASTVVQLAVEGHSNNNDDENVSKDESSSTSSSPSSSGLIDEMLSPTNEAYSRYTHLIAIPLELNHDLMVELESVQRAVLYHCPLLINACIVPEMTRMPMLYVDASSASSTALSGSNSDKSAEEISAKDLLGGKDIFSIMRNGGSAGGSGANGNDGTTNDDSSIGRNPITSELHSIVNDVINKQIYDSSGITDNANDAEPIRMSFHGLEMDGPANEVLHTVGMESSSGTSKLRSVLAEIRDRIEARGWGTALPADEPQDGIPDGIDDGQWRPRVPFMRLPANFDDSLPPPKGSDGKYGTYSAEKKASYIRQPQEGGNGISPIFWYRWWDDDFPATTVDDGGVRLREVGVYERTAPFGGTEYAFYLPHMKVELPGGDAALSKKEKEDADEAMKRMREKEDELGDGSGFDTMDIVDTDLLSSSSTSSSSEAEDTDEMNAGYEEADRRMMDALSEGGILWEGRDTFDKEGALNEDGSSFDTDVIDSPRFDNMEDEMRVARTDAERRLLQDLYNSSPSGDTNIVGFIDAGSERVDTELTAATPAVPLEEDYAVVAARALAANRRAENEDVSTSTGTAAVGSDTETAEPFKATQDSDEKRDGKTKKIVDKIRKPIATGDWSSSKPKDKIPWQENPVFKDWQNRVTMAEEDDESTSVSKPLPPFPAYEHFVGPWRMVSTPTAAFDGAMLFGDDSSRSENIILRVDGTIAGGPVLDVENMHRAAGGTWRFSQEEGGTGGDKDKAEDEAEEQTKLRIRLVVPPKKDRILVMEGLARQIDGRIVGSGKIDASSMVAPGTFGIPLAEAAKKAADEATRAREDDSSSSHDTEEDILRCSGEVWVEDARTGDNRKKLGRFVLEKLRITDPKKLVYTVPKPTRIQD